MKAKLERGRLVPEDTEPSTASSPFGQYAGSVGDEAVDEAVPAPGLHAASTGG